MKWTKVLIILCTVTIGGCFIAKKYFKVNPPNLIYNKAKSNLPLQSLQLVEGYTIDVYADKVKNARSMCLSPSGTLYVGTRSEGKVYAIQDLNGDMQADTMYTIYKDGNMPNGVAYKDGSLYVAEVNRILRWDNIDQKLANPGLPTIVYDKYPTEKHHGWKYIAFGPDGKLYVPVGAPCNICESKDPIFNSITRINPDGSGMEIVQSGVRNTVGFDWHPTSKHIYFTDNGRDLMGDDVPECELNRATKDKMHFGFPYCHQGDVSDPELGSKKACDTFEKPIAKLGPHTAPLGIEFYEGSMFAPDAKGQALIARHGSWNRSKKSGYDVVMAILHDDGTVKEVKPFITGWLDVAKDDVWGRPVDFETLPDGSVLISDDYADVIYRVSYKKI
jgi:glucose/arabinose dehydrogenase